MSTDLYETDLGRLSPDFVRIANTNIDGPDRFYARLPWNDGVPVPASFLSLKLCDAAPNAVYFPFPNFMIDAGGIDDWLEWRRFTKEINNLNGSGLFLIDGATPPSDAAVSSDPNATFAPTTEVNCSINCFAVAALLTAPDVVPPQRSAPPLPQRSVSSSQVRGNSCRCASFDFASTISTHIHSGLATSFEEVGGRWIKDLFAQIGRRNFREMREQKEAETSRRLDELHEKLENRSSAPQVAPLGPYSAHLQAQAQLQSPYFSQIQGPPLVQSPYFSQSASPAFVASAIQTPFVQNDAPESPASKRKLSNRLKLSKKVVSDNESLAESEDEFDRKREKKRMQLSMKRLGLF